jgi:glycyl-tRNA synthetase beta chain
VADKIDTIVGCFGIGLLPTGAQDPYALRRSALGVIHIFLGRGWRMPLRELVAASMEAYGDKLTRSPADVSRDVIEFFRGRLRSLLTADHATDVVDAVLAIEDDQIVDTVARVRALAAFRQREDFEPLATAFKRVMNITKGQEIGEGGPVASQLTDTHEVTLLHEAERYGGAAAKHVVARDYEGALAQLAMLKPAVDGFFDHVMVMAEDQAVRRNRLALLGQIRSLFSQIADFTRIQTPAAGTR